MKTDSVDKNNYQISTWKSPINIFYLLFPGFLINDLIFGQRVPEISWIEKNTEKSLNERTFYPCPHCQTLHSALKWRSANKTLFGNWFGLYCDQCGQIIPCLRNIFSFIVLALTSPIWYWFKDILKAKWLILQKKKFSTPLDYSEKEEKWWSMGLKWGLMSFILVSIFTFILGWGEFTWRLMLLNMIGWMIGGLIFGFIMKKFGAKNLEV